MGKQVPYLGNLEKVLNALPRNFGVLRQEIAAKGGDPLPFTTKSVGYDTIVYMPKDISGFSETVVQSTAIVYGLCKLAGFVVELSGRDFDQGDFAKTMDATNKALLGAYYCLQRDEIAPTTNIPKDYNSGWEFAQWYAFSKATNDLDHGDYLCIPRVTTLLPASGAAWQSGKQFTTYMRLSVLVRMVAQNCAPRVKSVSKFLKGEGYFLTKYVGKKPFGGLFLTEELSLLQEDWQLRQEKVRDLYKGIDSKIKLPAMGRQFKEYMEKFNVKLPTICRDIEDTASQRIPNLLVESGKGRSRRKTITKGGNLPEKLSAPGLSLSVRTIGRVMWSPLMRGITQATFTDWSIRLARNRLRNPGDTKVENSTEEAVKNLFSDSTVGVLVWGTMSVAANVYLEVYPDHTGNQAWDAAFGVQA